MNIQKHFVQTLCVGGLKAEIVVMYRVVRPVPVTTQVRSFFGG